MRHLASGAACPKDGLAAGRRKCEPCPAFISFRTFVRPGQPSISTVGCNHADDILDMVRRALPETPGVTVRLGSPPPVKAPPPPELPADTQAGKLLLALFGLVVLATLIDRREDRR